MWRSIVRWLKTATRFVVRVWQRIWVPVVGILTGSAVATALILLMATWWLRA